jgi:hypothetical protein
MGTCAALLLGATFAASQGLDTNRTTIVTFSAPVALPGVTLPAGSYMFRLADSQTNRNIVQVFDKDRTKIFATILAVAAQRSKPADDTVITFKESPAAAAPAVQYWYYPGETMGQEFAYPKKQAIEIANAAHTAVLAVDTEAENYDATKAGEISRVEPGADMAQSDNAAATQSSTSHGAAAAVTTPAENQQPTPAAQPSQPTQAPDMPSAKPEPSTAPAAYQTQANQPVGTSGKVDADMPPGHIAKGVGTSGTADADVPEGHVAKSVGTSGTLPHTASPLPLIGFAGVLALFAAAGVRALRKAVV